MQGIPRRMAGLALTAPLRIAPIAMRQSAHEQAPNHVFRRPGAAG